MVFLEIGDAFEAFVMEVENVVEVRRGVVILEVTAAQLLQELLRYHPIVLRVRFQMHFATYYYIPYTSIDIHPHPQTYIHIHRHPNYYCVAMDLPLSPIPPPLDPLYYILLIVVVAAALWFYLRKKGPCKSTMAIIGERFSGKTQLLISLNEGKKFETVPSIKNNECRRHLSGKEYRMVDYCGDAISKEEVLGELEGIHTVVHVIDGTDSKKIGEAALFIYRLLVSKKYQQHPCNYIIFFNKSDDKAYFGLPRLTKRLEDQIQTIKTSKRNQPEDNDAEEDYLKAVKDHFHLPSPFKVIQGSAIHDITSLSAILAHQ